jgi:hypothetical protein
MSSIPLQAVEGSNGGGCVVCMELCVAKSFSIILNNKLIWHDLALRNQCNTHIWFVSFLSHPLTNIADDVFEGG